MPLFSKFYFYAYLEAGSNANLTFIMTFSTQLRIDGEYVSSVPKAKSSAVSFTYLGAIAFLSSGEATTLC